MSKEKKQPIKTQPTIELPNGTIFHPYGIVARADVPAPPAPDWDFWANMSEVKLWQAVALSMNIDPDALNVDDPDRPKFKKSKYSFTGTQPDTFSKRLRLLIANKSIKNGFSPGTLSMTSPHLHGVQLDEFFPWALKLGWAIPDALLDMAREQKRKAATNNVKADTADEPTSAVKVSPPGAAHIPGKMPKTHMGRLAIEAAWEIEQDKKRAATVNEVISKLQTWADEGSRPEVLMESVKSKRGVEWRTTKGKTKLHDVDACGKALNAWMKSRA